MLLSQGKIRRARGKLVAISSLSMALFMAPLWLLCPRRSRLAFLVEQKCWTILLKGFGLDLRLNGTPENGALLAANHISWADIPALASTGRINFIAKGEVADWPIIGGLASRAGCLFVDRNKKADLWSQVKRVKARLDAGERLLIFPEGTTGSGIGVLPFHSSLFEGLRGPDSPAVQPVAIRYLSRDGQQLDPVSQRRVSWLGSDSLLPHALELAAQGGFVVEVAFLDPFQETDRKAAAKRCQTAISDWLAGSHAATLKRCA